MYDEEDVRKSFNFGFWIGVLSGFLSALGIFLLIGYHYS